MPSLGRRRTKGGNMSGYMPIDKKPMCKWRDCYAGLGLVGRGICFAGGDWQKPDCLEYKQEDDFLQEWKEVSNAA